MTNDKKIDYLAELNKYMHGEPSLTPITLTHCKHNVEIGYGACPACRGKSLDQMDVEFTESKLTR